MLSKETLSFLDDLKNNNNRDWFQSQKKRYEIMKKDYHQLVADFLEEMKILDPSLEMLEVKNCTFRINRDIRFSKDKSPYKSHLGIWMAPISKNGEMAGYYLHIEDGNCFFGGGSYNPMPEQLQKIRKEINFFHDDLKGILNNKSFKTIYSDLNRDESKMLKNPPRGYNKENPAIDFLKLKSFTATQKYDLNEIFQEDFVPKMTQKLIALKPFNDFINRALSETD